MQVFIVGTPLETAMALSKRHLNNQINEASIILAALNGDKAWSNHPCVLQYKGHERWLLNYMYCLIGYIQSDMLLALNSNHNCEQLTPNFHTQEYYEQMKRRLYTKDPEHYKQWSHLGTSEENWYFVNGEWRKYINGKRFE